MDFFKFIRNPSAPSFLSEGVIINNIKSATWIERYRDPGEFTFRAKQSSGMREVLPVGTFISHIDTLEVMMVESIELDDDVEESENEWVIKGRSLESYLRQRCVGDDIETYVLSGHRLYVTNQDYVLAFETSWEQTRVLIDHHLNAVFNIPNDETPGIIPISNQQHIGPSTTQERSVRKGNLHTAVLDLLAIDDFGIRSVRPNADNDDPATTELRIHNGFDLRDSVIFSYTFGDLENATYFWSDQALKTDYFCVSTYFMLRSDSGVTDIDRRILFVDCSDIDQHYTDADVSAAGDLIGDLMDVRGQQALRAQVGTSILAADVSKTTRYQFRKDYEVGDIVQVNGNFDISTAMRVVEHVEFQDETGETGYPTLAALNE